ncbi:MAG: serine hydrolase [Williamsia sp.]|nr:serine hydrolase [Williamsia sp.]
MLALCVTTKTFSQALPDSLTKRIDSLFQKWNQPNSPGCSIGIIRNDTLIYAKGYGMANLEYAIPNTAETPFHMASISKQFTAWSIILLARQGKLKLDDDIRKYLPWFPDLKTGINIRRLLNHTSGVRDQWQLLATAGTRLDDVITQDQIIKILSKQQALNFMPGDKYMYSNSGFTLLAEIVKSVSGQTLRQFTDSAIFKPLGMNNTHFHDDYTEIVKNRSYSYDRTDSIHFTNSILSYSNAGATSLFTNINDMSKWVMNFYTHKTGDQQVVDTLTKKGKLNNGRVLTYASGIGVSTYKGWKQFSHGGADAGYRTFITVFPDLKMGFLVFSNLGDFNTGNKTYAMADLFLKDTATKKEAVKKEIKDSTLALLKDTASAKKFVGYYVGEEGLPFSFDIHAGKLYYHIYAESSPLIQDSVNRFYIPQAPEISFLFAIKGKDTTVDITTGEDFHHLEKYKKDTARSIVLLKKYTGVYYCPELDCNYRIILKGRSLVLTHAKYPDAPLTLINEDHLTNDNWWMNHLKILRDSKNSISGFEVNSGRVMHLKFNKVE